MIKYDKPIALDEFIRKSDEYENSDVFSGEYFRKVLMNSDISLSGGDLSDDDERLTRKQKGNRIMAQDIENNNLKKQLITLNNQFKQMGLAVMVFPRTNKGGGSKESTTITGYKLLVYDPKYEKDVVANVKNGGKKVIDKTGKHSFMKTFNVAFSDTVKYGHSGINTPVDIVNVDKDIITRVKANEAEMMIVNDKLQTTSSSMKKTGKSSLDAVKAAFAFAGKKLKSIESKVNTNYEDKDDLSYTTGSHEYDSMLSQRVNVAPLLEDLKWSYGMDDFYRGKVMEIMALTSQAKSKEQALKIIEARESDLKKGFGKYKKVEGYNHFKKLMLNSYDRGVIWDFSQVGENAIRSEKMSTMDRNDIAGDIFMSPVLREQGRKNNHNIIGKGKTAAQRKADIAKKEKLFTKGILASKSGEAKGISYASGVMDRDNDNQIAYDASVLAVEMDDTDLANQGFSNLSVKEGQSVISKELAEVFDTSHHTMNYSYTSEDVEKAREAMFYKLTELKKKKKKKDGEKKYLAKLEHIFNEDGSIKNVSAFAAEMFRDSLKDDNMTLFKTDDRRQDSSFVKVYEDDYGGITVSGEGVTPMQSGRKLVDTFNNTRSAATVAQHGEFGKVRTSSGKYLSDYNIQAIFGRDGLDSRKYGTRLKSDINTTLIDLREVNELGKFFSEIKADSEKEVKEGDKKGEMQKQAAKFFSDVLEYDKSGKVYVTDDQEKVDKYLEKASKEQLSFYLDYLDTLRDKYGGNQGFGKVYGIDENGNLYRTKNTRTFRTNIGGDNNYTYGDYDDKGAVDFRTGYDSALRAFTMAAAKMTPEEKEKISKGNSKKSAFDVARDLASLFDVGKEAQQEWKDLVASNEESIKNMKNTLGKNKHFDVKSLDKSKYITVGMGKDFEINVDQDADQIETETWDTEKKKIINEEKTLTYVIDETRKARAKKANEDRAAEIANMEKEIADKEKELADLKKKNQQKEVKEKQKEIENKQKQIDKLKKKEKVKPEDFQVVIDTQGNKFSDTISYGDGKTYGFGGKAIYLDKNNGKSFGGYTQRGYHSEINNNLVRALNSGESEKIIDAANGLVKVMANSIRNKDGSDYKYLLKNKMPHSASGSSLGFNVHEIMSQDEYESEMGKGIGERDNLKILKSEIASYGAEISRRTAKDFLNSKKADESGKDLFSLKNLRDMLKKFGLTYTNKKGEARDIDKMKREEVVAHILDALTVGKSDWENAYRSGTLTEGLKGVLGRFPFMNGLDLDNISKIFIGDDLKGNAIKLGAGLAMKENADFDGDHEALKLAKLSPEERIVFDKSEAIKKAVMQKLAWIAKEKYEGEDQDRQVFSDDFYKGVSEKMIAQSAEIAGRRNKGAVGVFSNYASQLRNMMKDIGFDETNMIYGTEEERKNGVAAILIRTYFEAMEQDAISAKKIINRLTKQYKEQGVDKTAEEIEADALAYQKNLLQETDDLMKAFREKTITFEELNKKLKEMTILGPNGELNNRVTQAALLAVENGIDGGKEILRNLYSQNGSKYFEYDMYGRATNKDVEFAKTFEGEGKGGYEEWVKTKQAQSLLKKLDRAGVEYEGRDKDFYELLLSGKIHKADYGTATQGVFYAEMERGAQFAKDKKEPMQDGTVTSFIRSAANHTHTPEKRNYDRVYNFGDFTDEQLRDLEGGAEGFNEANDEISEAIAKLKENGGEIGNALAIILEAITGFAKGTGAVAKDMPMTAREGARVLANAKSLIPYSISTLTDLIFPWKGSSKDPDLVNKILKNKDKKYFGYDSESQLKSIVGDGIDASVALRGNVYGSKSEYIAKLRELASEKKWEWNTSEDLEKLFDENKESLQKENDPNIDVIQNAKEGYENDKKKYFEFLETVHGKNGFNDMDFFLAKNNVEKIEDLLPGWERQIDALYNYFSPENMAEITVGQDEKGNDITRKAKMLPEAGFVGVTGRDEKYSYVGRTDMAGLRNETVVDPDGTERQIKAFRTVDLKTKLGEKLAIKDILQGALVDNALQQNLHAIHDIYEKKDENGIVTGGGYKAWLDSAQYKAMEDAMKKAGKTFDPEELYYQLREADVAGDMILRTNPDNLKTEFYQIGNIRQNIKDRKILDLFDRYLHGENTKEELQELVESLPTEIYQQGIITEEAEKDPKLKYKHASKEKVAADYLDLEKQRNAALERRKTVNYLLNDTANEKTDAKIIELKKEADDLDKKLKEIDDNIKIVQGMHVNLHSYDENGKKVDVDKEIRADKRQQKAIRDEAIQEEQAKAKTKLETALTRMADIQARMQERTIRSNAVGLHGLSEEQKLAYAMANKQDQSEYDALAKSVQGVDWEKAVGGADQMAEVTNKVTEATESANQRLVAINADLNPTIWKQLTMSVKGYFNQMVRGQLVWKIMGQLQRSIRTLIEDAKKLDSVLVNLQIVTGDTRENTRGLITTYASLAKQMSVTTSEVAAAANDWLRQGYSVSESIDLVTASLQLSKLGMIDSGKATSYLTSMLKGFKLEAGDAVSIVDKLTKIDMSAATSAGDIAEALRQFATTAQLSGMDLNESIAMATTIMDVSQKDASSTGNAIKTMLSRFGNVKAGTYSGMNITGDQNETTESLNDIEKVLRKIGISLRSSNLEFREFDDVLDDIASKWDTLDSVSKNAIATAMAGTRQRESFLVLMENYDKYKDFIEEAANAEGTAAEKYKAYEDSLEASQKKLSAAWEELTSKTEIVDFFKTINELGAQMLKWLPTVFSYFTVLISGKVANSIRGIMSASGSLNLKGGAIKLLNGLVSGGLVSEKFGWGKRMGSTLNRGGMIDSLIRKGTSPMLQELRIIAKNTTGLGTMHQAGEVLNASSSDMNGVAVNGQASLDDIIKNPSLSLRQKRKAVENFYNSELDKNKEQLDAIKEKSKGNSLYGFTIDNKLRHEDERLKQERKRLKQEEKKFLADFDEHRSFMASRATDPQLADGTRLSDLKPHTDKIKFGKGKGKEYTYYTAKGHKGRISEKDYEALKQQQTTDKENAENEYKNLKKAARTSKMVSGVASGIMAFFTADTTNAHRNPFTGETEYNETNDAGAKVAMKVVSGVFTGLGTYLLGPLGGILGQFAGQLFNTYLMGKFFPALQRENINRDRRNKAEETKKKVEESSSYISAVTELANKMDLTSDDYKKLTKVQQEMRDYLSKSENSEIKKEFEKYVRKILENQEVGNGLAEKSFTQLTQLTDMTASDRRKVSYAMKLAQQKQENVASLNEYEEKLYDYYDKADKAKLAIYDRAGLEARETAKAMGGDYDVLYENVSEERKKDNNQDNDDPRLIANATASIVRNTLRKDIESRGIEEQISYLKNLLESGSLTEEMKTQVNIAIEQLKNISDTQEAIRKTVERQRISEGIYEMSVGKNADGSEKTLLDMSPAALQKMGLDEIIYRMAEYLEKKYGGMLDGTSYFYTDENGKSQVKGTARKEIISALKSSNEDIYNVIMGKNYTLSDVFGMKDGETKTQMLSNFANALSVSVDQLQSVADVFGDLTLGDVSSSAEDLLAKLQSMETVIGNIASGTQTWATTLQTIMKNYPELIGYATDEYTISLAMFQKMDSFKQLMTNAQFENIISNETYFKEFSQRLTDNLSTKEKEEFDDLKLTTVKDVMTYVSNNDTDLSKKVGGLLRKEMKNIKLSSEIQMQLAEKLVAIKGAQLDKEIDNLTSQKEALQDINSQREYENKLIEAKLKLEEATKEKKRVWREGVGWVYEEDQAAISEAKDNLDSVSNEKAISALTQQINQLNADKKNLNDILSDQREATQEGFLKAFEKSDGVTNGSLESFGSSIGNFIKTSDENAADRFDKWMNAYNKDRTKGISNLQTAWKNLTTAKDKMNKTGLTEEQKKAATENYNAALDKFQTQYSTGVEKGYWSQKDFEEGGSLYEEFGKDNEASKAATGGTGWGKAAYDDSLYVHDEDGKWKKFKYNSDKNTVDISNDEWNSFFDKHKGGANFYNQRFGDIKNGHRAWVRDTSEDPTGRYIYKNAENHPDLQGFAGWMSEEFGGYTMVKLNGNWYRLVNNSIKKIDAPEIVSEKAVPEDVRKAGGKFKKGSLDISKGNKVPLLMNEAGTEAVVTPGGTITALPSHSGIVPADITSNLWNLGNYAPDLLSALQRQTLLGMNVAGTSTDNSVDNSVSINTVQMTVDADSGFNVDSFVQQLQQVAALTRNNKH